MTTNALMPDKTKAILMVGAGGIVRDGHLPAYAKAGFKVSAIYDLDPDKAGKMAACFGVPTVSRSLDELIEIGSQDECVFDLAIPASEIVNVLERLPDQAGVLIQKPMGETIEQAREILCLCRNKRLTAGVNFQLRHAPYIVAAKQMIDAGEIGELHDIDVRMNVSTPWHLWEFLYGLPRMEILYNSIHYIDMIRYFLGNPNQVMARTIKHPNTHELANSRSSIIMDYGEWTRANINTNHGHNFGALHQESCFKFEGTAGAIKIVAGLNLNYPDGLPDQFEFISLKNNIGWQKLNLNGSWFPDAFIGPMAGLMCKMEDREFEYINSVEDAIHTMKVVEECYQSNEKISNRAKGY